MGYDQAGEPTAITDRIHAVAAKMAQSHARELEQWCERMLTDPRGWGVLEHTFGGLVWEIELSPRVPFGEIHVHQVQYDGFCLGCDAEARL